MLHRQRAIGALLSALLLPSGCGEGSSSTATETSPETAAPTVSSNPSGSPPSSGTLVGTTIEITVRGEQLSPQAARIKVAVGEPVRLHIVADQPGVLHVHSSPEQELSYPAGTTVKTFTIARPGVVELESHTLDRLVAQLEVR